MLITQGSKDINDGDVNSWGIKKPLSISKSQKFKLKLAEELEMQMTEDNIPSQRFKIKHLLFQLTKWLEQMRTRQTGEFLVEQRLEKLRRGIWIALMLLSMC